MSLKHDLIQLLKPYYLFNILLSFSYLIFKRTPIICNYLFNTEHCEFEGRESEILFFLIIVVALRTRKSGAISMLNYLSSSFIYTKIANLILWFSADLIMGIIYAIIFILSAIILPQPTYSGPDNVIYFRDLSGLEEELNGNKKCVWLIAFYTVWNPACVQLAPIFAKLSNDYHLDNLKFGKIDVGRYPDAAKKYRIDDGSLSKQLPTLILFQDGKEILRRPIKDGKGKFINFTFSETNIKSVFGLNSFYEKCKSNSKNSANKLHVE